MANYEPIPVSSAKKMHSNTPDSVLPDELVVLCDRLQRAMRGIKFANKSKNKIWCYLPNHPLTIGYITYGQLQDDTTNRLWGIVSHTIDNGKYSEYRVERRTKMTSKLETAVKLAKKFMRPHTLLELNKYAKSDMTYELSKLASDARDTASSAIRTIGEDTLWAELKRLYQTDHEFHDPTLRDKLTQMYEAEARASQIKEKYKTGNGLRMAFVNISESVSGQRFECAEVKRPTSSWEHEFEDTHVYYGSDLPEHLTGAIAVLSMLGDKEFVEGVGFKCSDTMYYVELP